MIPSSFCIHSKPSLHLTNVLLVILDTQSSQMVERAGDVVAHISHQVGRPCVLSGSVSRQTACPLDSDIDVYVCWGKSHQGPRTILVQRLRVLDSIFLGGISAHHFGPVSRATRLTLSPIFKAEVQLYSFLLPIGFHHRGVNGKYPTAWSMMRF